LDLLKHPEDKAALEDQMNDLLSSLRALERPYRADVLYNLRNAINERFYGLREADDKYKEFAGIDHPKMQPHKPKGLGESIMSMVFGQKRDYSD
jgi:hypothetical protein